MHRSNVARLRTALVVVLCALALATPLALTGCSGSSTTEASGSAATEVTARLADVLGSLNAAYVGHDEDDLCVAYGFGQLDGAPLAVLLTCEDGEYRSWAGSFENGENQTVTITDSMSGEATTVTVTQGTDGSVYVYKDGIAGTASLVPVFTASGADENLSVYDESLVDYEITYLR